VITETFRAWIRTTTNAVVSKRVAPYMLLGPITGPFVAGVVFNFREGRPVLGVLYMVALSSWYVAMPVMAVHAL
jgi:hypothetical protein